MAITLSRTIIPRNSTLLPLPFSPPCRHRKKAPKISDQATQHCTRLHSRRGARGCIPIPQEIKRVTRLRRPAHDCRWPAVIRGGWPLCRRSDARSARARAKRCRNEFIGVEHLYGVSSLARVARDRSASVFRDGGGCARKVIAWERRRLRDKNPDYECRCNRMRIYWPRVFEGIYIIYAGGV